ELQVRGPRVVIPETGALIAPWSEKVRYGANKNNGYHGGLSPQEMVVPIVVLCSAARYPDGFVEAPVDTPAWWEEPFSESPPGGPSGPESRTLPPGVLFDPDEEIEAQARMEPQVSGWIRRLLASPVFQGQMKLAGSAAPLDTDLIPVLAALDSGGGTMSEAMLSQSTGLSPGRLRDLLVGAERVLNIDGFPVLTRGGGSVALDLGLVTRQFDL